MFSLYSQTTQHVLCAVSQTKRCLRNIHVSILVWTLDQLENWNCESWCLDAVPVTTLMIYAFVTKIPCHVLLFTFRQMPIIMTSEVNNTPALIHFSFKRAYHESQLQHERQLKRRRASDASDRNLLFMLWIHDQRSEFQGLFAGLLSAYLDLVRFLHVERRGVVVIRLVVIQIASGRGHHRSSAL